MKFNFENLQIAKTFLHTILSYSQEKTKVIIYSSSYNYTKTVIESIQQQSMSIRREVDRIRLWNSRVSIIGVPVSKLRHCSADILVELI